MENLITFARGVTKGKRRQTNLTAFFDTCPFSTKEIQRISSVWLSVKHLIQHRLRND